MTKLPATVIIVEVGPRDGLQNESVVIPTAVKAEFIRALSHAGLAEIEATSFVRPERIPQLSDAEELVALLRQVEPRLVGSVTALVPNERGLDRALQCGIRSVAVFTAASETFVRRNIGMSIRESLDTFDRMMSRCRADGVAVRGYVSTCWVCPFEGEISPDEVLPVVQALLGMGARQVSLGDTVGAAAPSDVSKLLNEFTPEVRTSSLALHFHDTSGTALANVYAGLQAGVSVYDSSAGGLGGCPYAPGAAGNLATEDLVYMLDRMGIHTGVDLEKVAAAASLLAPLLPHPLPSRQYARLRATS